MRALVIINPCAGGKNAPPTTSRVELARRVLGEHGIDSQPVLTEHVGHAEELARGAASDGIDVVFAWGGDGTVNEVARALAFTDTALAIVPAGSGNGLARGLKIPRHPAAAFAYALQHTDRRIDGGSLGGRFFVNVAGVGLDAEVAWRYGRSGRRGLLPYVMLALRRGVRYEALEYRLTLDDETLVEQALVVAVANSAEYGHGAIVAPEAMPDDERLNVVIIRERSVAARLIGARRLFDGTLLEAGGVVSRTVRRLVIEADRPLRFHVDGEPVEGSHVLVGVVHPRAIKIRA